MIFSLNNKLITKFYMLTISKKKNYKIIKKVISPRIIKIFKKELNNLVNKIINKKN